MSIADIKHMGLFEVDVLRIVTDLDNKAITDYTLQHREKWDRYTTYHDQELNKDWQYGLPDRARLENAMIEAGHEFVKRTKRKHFRKVKIPSLIFIYTGRRG